MLIVRVCFEFIASHLALALALLLLLLVRLPLHRSITFSNSRHPILSPCPSSIQISQSANLSMALVQLLARAVGFGFRFFGF